MKTLLSVCCNVFVKVLDKEPEYIGEVREIFYFYCTKCHKPCHLKDKV